MFSTRLLSDLEISSLYKRINFEEFAGRSVLVTGASGMLGSYLVSAMIAACELGGLEAPSFTLLVRDAKSRNLESLVACKKVEIIEGRLLDWVPNRVFDFLIHAASPASPTKYSDSRELIEANVGFLEHLNRLGLPENNLFISTGEVYGTDAPEHVAEQFTASAFPDLNRSAYPIAKLSAETALLEAASQNARNCYIARLFHTFGPGIKKDDGRSFADFIWSAAQGSDIVLRGKGNDIRTFLYLEDAVAGLLTILVNGKSGQTYNVGSDEPESVLDFAFRVQRNSPLSISVQIGVMDEVSYEPSPNKVLVPSIKKLESIGWRECANKEIGVLRTINWARGEL